LMCTYYEPVFFKLPSVGDGLGNVKLQWVGLGWVQNFWDGLGWVSKKRFIFNSGRNINTLLLLLPYSRIKRSQSI